MPCNFKKYVWCVDGHGCYIPRGTYVPKGEILCKWFTNIGALGDAGFPSQGSDASLIG